MFSYDKLISLCESTGCEYSLTAELKDYTSFKIGGKADIMIFPNSISVLSELVAFIRARELPLLVIGKGSNLLISDEGFRGVVINTSHLDSLELLDDTTIKCSCGVSLARLCRFALENSLTGLRYSRLDRRRSVYERGRVRRSDERCACGMRAYFARRLARLFLG